MTSIRTILTPAVPASPRPSPEVPAQRWEVVGRSLYARTKAFVPSLSSRGAPAPALQSAVMGAASKPNASLLPKRWGRAAIPPGCPHRAAMLPMVSRVPQANAPSLPAEATGKSAPSGLSLVAKVWSARRRAVPSAAAACRPRSRAPLVPKRGARDFSVVAAPRRSASTEPVRSSTRTAAAVEGRGARPRVRSRHPPRDFFASRAR